MKSPYLHSSFRLVYVDLLLVPFSPLGDFSSWLVVFWRPGTRCPSRWEAKPIHRSSASCGTSPSFLFWKDHCLLQLRMSSLARRSLHSPPSCSCLRSYTHLRLTINTSVDCCHVICFVLLEGTRDYFIANLQQFIIIGKHSYCSDFGSFDQNERHMLCF